MPDGHNFLLNQKKILLVLGIISSVIMHRYALEIWIDSLVTKEKKSNA